MQTDSLLNNNENPAVCKDNENVAAAKRNVGIDVLRVWLCFSVILYHFHLDGSWDGIITGIISYPRTFAVPVFMLISFILLSRKFADRTPDRAAIGKRLYRLIVPIVFWSIVYFICFRLLFYVGLTNKEMGLEYLLSQLLLGHSINFTMWFLNVLLFLTVLWTIVFSLAGMKSRIISLLVLTAISFYLQYSGLYSMWFSPLDWDVRYPLGRLIEMIPYMCGGSIIGLVGIPERRRLNVWLVCAVLLIMMIWVYEKEWLPVSGSFGYSGVPVLFLSVVFAAVFILFPFDYVIRNKKLLAAVEFVSKYTIGIYCLHLLVGNITEHLSRRFFPSAGDFACCIMVFATGLGICHLIAKLPFKWVRHAVK